MDLYNGKLKMIYGNTYIKKHTEKLYMRSTSTMTTILKFNMPKKSEYMTKHVNRQ